MPGFQTKAPVVTSISGDNFRLIPPIKLNFLFAKEDSFLMLFQTSTKLTFGPSDILVITSYSALLSKVLATDFLWQIGW